MEKNGIITVLNNKPVKIKSIRKIKGLAGKRVLLRSDFNVPMRGGRVADDYKIIRNMPTIQYLVKERAKVIIASHLGRPDGAPDPRYSLEPVAEALGKALGAKAGFASDVCGVAAGTAAARMKNRDVLFLENIRFEPGEKKNDPKFAKRLASLADIYVNDAFAVSHRADASVSAIKRYLPSYAGLLLEGEVENLSRIIEPRKPLVLIIGGVKLETKIPVIEKFRKRARHIILGGALANNFLAAHGYDIGRSLVDAESIRFAKNYIKKGYDRNLVLPVDVITSSAKSYWDAHPSGLSRIKDKDYIFDIGPKTIKLYKSLIASAATAVWNGPMGLFEERKFKHGTYSIARAMAIARGKGVFCAAGGGETVEALRSTRTLEDLDWVSTGGGAMLEFLGGSKMPGLIKLI